jgi:hypothetical protein
VGGEAQVQARETLRAKTQKKHVSGDLMKAIKQAHDAIVSGDLSMVRIAL